MFLQLARCREQKENAAMTRTHRDDPPDDYVGRLIAGWREERPDLAVDPIAIVYRVGRLAAHFATEVDRVFQHSGVTSADFAVLANLRRAGAPFQISQRRLADALRLTSGTVSVRIDRLAHAGLVRRAPDPDDRRGVLVSLTADGEQLFDALAPEHLANEARLVAALDADDQAELARLLQLLLVEYELTDEPADARLGMTVAPAHVTQQRRAGVGLPPAPGLLVTSVRPGGPASVAGLEAGDLLVGSARRPMRSLSDLDAATREGAAVDLRLQRGDEVRRVTVRP
jgi:DNA-binding MarR family transcriptional regulator